MGSGSRTSFSLEGRRHGTCRLRPLPCPLWAPTTEAREVPSPQRLTLPTCLEPVRRRPKNCAVKMFNKNIKVSHISTPRVSVGSSRRQEVIEGGVHTTDVIMRKRSENRGYTDEHIRDSIVMGEVSSNFPDLSKFPLELDFLSEISPAFSSTFFFQLEDIFYFGVQHLWHHCK